MNFFPLFIQNKLNSRHHLKQMAGNAGWLVADKIVRMGVGLLVGIWVARYLGPEQFGLLSYAQAFVALFSSVASLGLEGIVIRDILRCPEKRGETIGSAFYLKLAGGAFCILLSVGAIFLIHPDDRLTLILVAIIASGSIFQAFDVIDFWFQSQTRSKLSVLARNVAFLLVSAVKVVLILKAAPLKAFAVAGLVEIMLGAAGLLYIYRRHGGYPVLWQGSIKRAKVLISESWPLILSGISIMVYLRIDQIMLREMGTNHDVGIYSVALKISELWYFIPIAITSSAFPAIIASKEIGSELYYQRLQKLFRLMVMIAYCIVIPVSIFSGFIITSLYGGEFIEAAPILTVHVWAIVFVFLGVAQGPWNIAEGYVKLSMQRTLAGAVCNIVLNMYLIPHYKGLGAAIATTISYAISSWAMNYMDTRTRPIFYFQLRAMLLIKSRI